MAKFGVDVTKMSDVSGSGVFSSNVQQGVVDKSDAMSTAALTGLIGEAGKMGMDAYKGYQLADIEAEQEKNIAEYMQSKQNPAIAQGAHADAIALRSGIASLWNNFDTTIEDVNPIEKQFQEKLQTYQRAAEEGVMTPDQLSARILATTREAINRNPGLYQELVAHSEKVQELSGIKAIVKRDELQRATADSYIKDLQGRAKAVGYSYTSTTPIATLESETIQLEQDQLRLKQAKNAKDKHDLVTFDQARNWEQTYGDNVQSGSMQEFKTGALTLFKDNSTTNYGNIAFALKDFATAKKEEFTSLIPVQIRNTPEAKGRIERYNKAIDDTLSSMEKLGAGDDARKALENSLAIVKTAEELKIQERYPAAATRLMMDAVRGAPQILLEDADIRKKYMAVVGDMLSGNLSSPNIDQALPKKVEDKTMSIPLTTLGDMGRKEKDWSGFNKLLTNYNTKTGMIEDPKQKQTYLYNNIEALSKLDMTGIDSGTYGQVNKMVGSYLNDPQYGLRSMFTYLKDTNVTADVLPNGTLHFVGEGADRFNGAYANKINTALQAYANAQGLSTKEAAGNFYPEYFLPNIGAEQLLQDKDIGKPVKRIEQKLPPTRKGEVSGKISTLQEDIKIAPSTQKTRDDKVLQMLYQELADQQSQGKVDPELIKDISFREKRLGKR